MRLRYMLLVFAFPLAGAAEWHAPLDADFKVILDEAREDIDEGRFDEALKKYQWFQSYSVKQNSVRYSMYFRGAIEGLLELENKCPEAKGTLRKFQKKLGASFLAKDVHSSVKFRYFAMINSILDEDKRTVDAFILLDKNYPAVAKQVFNSAYRELVKEGEYTLCGKYITPKYTSKRLMDNYLLQVKRTKESPSEMNKDLLWAIRKGTLEYTARLIAILVLNDEAQLAQEIADDLREEIGSAEAIKVIDAALDGNMPSFYIDSLGEEH